VSNLAYLAAAVVLSVAGSLVVWLRTRPPRSTEDSVAAFSRQLRALAPPTAPAGTDRPPGRGGSEGSG
jgi:hypothetical protein